MPVVVGLGVRGVFSIIQEVWQTMPSLCLRALREFLNILQGQSPAGLRSEPKETTDALFELLMKMVVEPVPPDNELAADLSSVACGCLLSLVVALGDTGKMLTAVSSLITAPHHLTQNTLQIPQIFYSLQDSVKAVLLGCVTVADWFEKGVPAKSFVEEWTISVPLEEGGEREEEGGRGGAAVACDGRFLYIHGSFGLAKVGSGYGNTQRGLVYKMEPFRPREKAWLGLAEGKLFYYPLGQGEDSVLVINADTLQEETSLDLDVDCLGSQCLFSDGECIGQIKVKKEGGCVLRKFATLSSPMLVVEEKALQLSQKTVLVMGKAKYDSQESIHTLYQDTSDQVVRVMASRNSVAVQTTSGKLLYTGSGAVFGITSKDVSKGEWKEVALPDKNVKVEHCACDNAGTFCLVVSDKGTVYFGGVNKKGEAGEAGDLWRQI
ncbi:E3 ubiquitin-protein ligase MYCBP2 [Geodia barretti]|uniref:E3 ubiquitin-protein ligase MYCBP2 n=1 Tax=Geodia barretti TaxID=519541 RepID=A0AA35XH86_GEOBA|nr:E3 ubiquitin-protein ligase MYCBP2 [Geodia barretti]